MQEKKTYEFDAKNSVGTKFDRVIVPNVPLASAFDMMRQGFFMKSIVKSVINVYNVRIKEHTIHPKNTAYKLILFHL